MTIIANKPKPPYDAVGFKAVRTEGDFEYAQMSDKMFELDEKQAGFLGLNRQEMNWELR